MIQKLPRPSLLSPAGVTMETSSEMMGPCKETAQLIAELMSSVTSVHQLHLKVSGLGSYAAHKALNEFYDTLPDLIDGVAEQYQGAREKILEYPMVTPANLQSTEDAMSLLKGLYTKTNDLQKIMPFSEIVNQLDEVKSVIASTKYKLLFLK